MNKPILPSSTLGVLGGGQLGRMFAMAARRMGYRVHTYSPDSDTPAGQVSDLEIQAPYEDLDAVRRFAQGVSVMTFEFENIPLATTEEVVKHVPVRPSGQVLYVTQHRLREKDFLSKAGFPVTLYRSVRSSIDIAAALKSLGGKGVLKTAGFGYDGKGQCLVSSVDEAIKAFQDSGAKDTVLEAWVDYQCELSVVAARGGDGSFVHYGVIQNDHRHHVLDISMAPAAIPEKTWNEAIEIAHAILDSLQVVGVLCVEFFFTRDGRLLINELAPRPHNSGHLTMEACVTSQFEQQLRAVCGLPLGSTEFLKPAAMANLMGDLWKDGPLEWSRLCQDPEIKLHLYGKEEARPGRKMGHVTALGVTAHQAAQKVMNARASLLVK